MSGKTALVTGATGFLGRQVVKAFQSHDWIVKGTGYLMFKGAGFPAYFRRFYRLPYDNWSSLSHHRMDHVLRFERRRRKRRVPGLGVSVFIRRGRRHTSEPG